jgi:hypothetical protein
MLDILPEMAVYPVQHLPIIKAYADQLGLVSLINHYVPTADGRGRGHCRAGSRVRYAEGPEPAVPLRRVLRAPRHRAPLRQGLTPPGLYR